MPRDVAVELHSVKKHFAEVAGSVSLRLVIEMRRRRMPAFSAGSDGPRSHALTELDDGHETVAARAIPFLRTRVRVRAERCERSPAPRGEADRRAWCLAVLEVIIGGRCVCLTGSAGVAYTAGINNRNRPAMPAARCWAAASSWCYWVERRGMGDPCRKYETTNHSSHPVISDRINKPCTLLNCR